MLKESFLKDSKNSRMRLESRDKLTCRKTSFFKLPICKKSRKTKYLKLKASA